MNGQYKIGDIVLGNWTLTRMIGEGAFGSVYEAEREDFGKIYKAAIKIITIPKSESEIKAIRAEGLDEDSVTAYFRSFVEEIVSEFALMSELKGTANIVSYEDHTVTEHTGAIGWDILIRMELLTPLLDYNTQNAFTRQTITKAGIDICKALELCQKFNIIHRDIKPENIFVSRIGDFKLGDFGIARTVEKTASGLSKKGTYTYMAPEVYRGDAYGSSVDIYSLGIVLYRLLNDNRGPFMPQYPAPITHSDREQALVKRISGEQLPLPKNADGRLAEIVLKACAHNPKERFSSPMQMREELEAILYNKEEAPIIYPDGDEVPIKSVEYINESQPTEAPAAALDAPPDVPLYNLPQDTPVEDGTVAMFKSTQPVTVPVAAPPATPAPVPASTPTPIPAPIAEAQQYQQPPPQQAVPENAQPYTLQNQQPQPMQYMPQRPVSKPPSKNKGKIIGIVLTAVSACVLIAVLLILVIPRIFDADPPATDDPSAQLGGENSLVSSTTPPIESPPPETAQPGDDNGTADSQIDAFNELIESVPDIIADFTGMFGEGILDTERLSNSSQGFGNDSGIVFSLYSDTLFNAGDTRLLSNSTEVIRFIGDLLGTVENRILISGHTDNVPTQTSEFPTNYYLALAQVLNVREVLYEKILGTRISTLTFGQFVPVADNGTPEGRQANRRIEIIVLHDSEPDIIDRLHDAALAVLDDYHLLFARIISAGSRIIDADSATIYLSEFIMRYGPAANYNNITLTDADGTVLVRSNYYGFYGDSITHLQSVETALTGATFIGYEFDVFIQKETARVAVPVYDHEGNIVGVFLIGG